MKSQITPPCDNCGKRTTIGNKNGIPNMLGFGMEDGRMINLCSDCIMKLGAMSEAEKKKFFEDLGVY